MKHILIAISVIVLFSCSNDDDNVNTNFETSIIGIWEIEEIKENDKSITLSECFQLNTIEFRTDRTVTFTENIETSSGCETISSGNHTYVIDNNVIEVFYSDDGIEPNGYRDLFTIIDVTDKTLSIITIENSITSRLTYKKL